MKNNDKFDFVIDFYPFSAKWSKNKKFLMDDRFSKIKILSLKTRGYWGACFIYA